MCHEDGIQAITFDKSADTIVTAGADGIVKMWSN